MPQKHPSPHRTLADISANELSEAVRKMATALHLEGTAVDGLIEACETVRHNFIEKGKDIDDPSNF